MSAIDSLEKQTVSKVFWQLAAFLTLLYIILFLAGVNIGYAALAMNNDLEFSNAACG